MAKYVNPGVYVDLGPSGASIYPVLIPRRKKLILKVRCVGGVGARESSKAEMELLKIQNRIVHDQPGVARATHVLLSTARAKTTTEMFGLPVLQSDVSLDDVLTDGQALLVRLVDSYFVDEYAEGRRSLTLEFEEVMLLKLLDVADRGPT